MVERARKFSRDGGVMMRGVAPPDVIRVESPIGSSRVDRMMISVRDRGSLRKNRADAPPPVNIIRVDSGGSTRKPVVIENLIDLTSYEQALEEQRDAMMSMRPVSPSKQRRQDEREREAFMSRRPVSPPKQRRQEELEDQREALMSMRAVSPAKQRRQDEGVVSASRGGGGNDSVPTELRIPSPLGSKRREEAEPIRLWNYGADEAASSDKPDYVAPWEGISRYQREIEMGGQYLAEESVKSKKSLGSSVGERVDLFESYYSKAGEKLKKQKRAKPHRRKPDDLDESIIQRERKKLDSAAILERLDTEKSRISFSFDTNSIRVEDRRNSVDGDGEHKESNKTNDPVPSSIKAFSVDDVSRKRSKDESFSRRGAGTAMDKIGMPRPQPENNRDSPVEGRGYIPSEEESVKSLPYDRKRDLTIIVPAPSAPSGVPNQVFEYKKEPVDAEADYLNIQRRTASRSNSPRARLPRRASPKHHAKRILAVDAEANYLGIQRNDDLRTQGSDVESPVNAEEDYLKLRKKSPTSYVVVRKKRSPRTKDQFKEEPDDAREFDEKRASETRHSGLEESPKTLPELRTDWKNKSGSPSWNDDPPGEVKLSKSPSVSPRERKLRKRVKKLDQTMGNPPSPRRSRSPGKRSRRKSEKKRVPESPRSPRHRVKDKKGEEAAGQGKVGTLQNPVQAVSDGAQQVIMVDDKALGSEFIENNVTKLIEIDDEKDAPLDPAGETYSKNLAISDPESSSSNSSSSADRREEDDEHESSSSESSEENFGGRQQNNTSGAENDVRFTLVPVEMSYQDENAGKESETSGSDDNASEYVSEHSGSKTADSDTTDSDFELRGPEMYDTCTSPFVVQFLDKTCAWLEGDEPMCGSRKPSLLQKFQSRRIRKVRKKRTDGNGAPVSGKNANAAKPVSPFVRPRRNQTDQSNAVASSFKTQAPKLVISDEGTQIADARDVVTPKQSNAAGGISTTMEEEREEPNAEDSKSNSSGSKIGLEPSFSASDIFRERSHEAAEHIRKSVGLEETATSTDEDASPPDGVDEPDTKQLELDIMKPSGSIVSTKTSASGELESNRHHGTHGPIAATSPKTYDYEAEESKTVKRADSAVKEVEPDSVRHHQAQKATSPDMKEYEAQENETVSLAGSARTEDNQLYLNGKERLAALELAEKLRRRAANLKRRRKTKERQNSESVAETPKAATPITVK